MQTIWGFDLGVTSVGFAVIRYEPGSETGCIERLGVRIFPECRQEKDLAPRNAARRQARLARRQLRRRRWRRVHTRELLAKAGLLPSADARPPAGQDPYALRARGLEERLEPNELGWALFHLLKRRGFQGSRKHAEIDPGSKKKKPADQTQQEKDDAESQAKAETLAAKLAGRPLATYLATITTTIEHPQRRRGVGQTRPMVTDELDRLWRTQSAHHPAILTETLRQELDRVALFQRPTFFRTRTIGFCDLEPTEPRALKAEWLNQQAAMLGLVNSLRLASGNQRPLDPEERARAIDYLSRTRVRSWKGLRTAIGWKSGMAFTQERGEKESVRGNATEAALRAALGAGFPGHPHAQSIRDAIAGALHAIEYRPARGGTILEIRDHAAIEAERARFAERAIRDWHLTQEQADKLARLELPDGHGTQSLRALASLLPRLEAGEPYATARKAAYPPQESGPPARELPGPNAGELNKKRDLLDPFLFREMQRIVGAVRNPTVIRTLGELQKVANTLLRVHGRPDLIRLEMARELKQSPDDRRKTDSDQARREKLRRAAREAVASEGKPAEGREGEENVLRYLLWQEQGGRCPYSGEPIGLADALSAHATEIDHIFPASRSLDDAQSNKVLCLARENRAKRNRTPYEWLHADTNRWHHLETIVWPTMRKSGWPKSKWRRCQTPRFEQADDEEGFTARQLNDTSYIARVARDYLGLLWGGGQEGLNHVQVTPGRATAQLRRALGIGLSKLLHDGPEEGAKIRDDHRHHAVDALAVALTSPATVQQLSRWWATREQSRRKPDFCPPWPDFRQQAKAAVEAILVSHRVQAKRSGKLHKDTFMQKTDETEREFRIFKTRKKIIDLSRNDLLEKGRNNTPIADRGVKKAIVSHLARNGISDIGTASEEMLGAVLANEVRLPLKSGAEGPIIRKVRVKIKLQEENALCVDAKKKTFARYAEDTNYRLLIFRNDNSIESRTIRKTVQERPSGPTRPPELQSEKLLMSLFVNDTLMREHDGKRDFLRVRNWDQNGNVFYWTLAQSVEGPKRPSWSPGTLVRLGWRKIFVDPIGRIAVPK